MKIRRKRFFQRIAEIIYKYLKQWNVYYNFNIFITIILLLIYNIFILRVRRKKAFLLMLRGIQSS